LVLIFLIKKYKDAINNKTLIVSKNKNNIDGFTRFNIYSKNKASKELDNYLKEIPSLRNKNILFIGDTAVNKSNNGIGGNLRKEIESIAKKEKANIITIPWNDKVEKWNIKNGFKIIHSDNKKLPSSVAIKEII